MKRNVPLGTIQTRKDSTMAFWDFVKDAGKSIFGNEAQAAPAPSAKPAPAAPGQAGAAQAGTAQAGADGETDRKVAALKA